MISLHEVSELSSILNLKSHYLQSLVAPLDDMWEVGFINSSPHWEIRMDGEQAGYYAVNTEGTLLQFHVLPAFEKHGKVLFDHVVAQNSVNQAVASTIDPTFLSFCLDVQKKVTVHTYLYEIHTQKSPAHLEAGALSFRLIEASELDRTIAFQQACLGGGSELSGWLRGYSGSLIERKELYVLCRVDAWIGLGECRRSDTQEAIANLGMMVSLDHRRKGWATHILTLLSTQCAAEGLHAICSTTVENVGAQKAISRAGFVSRHRMMNISL